MGKSRKSQSKDQELVEEEEETVALETFHKSLEELKKALSILGFEITPKKKPSTETIASPIADVINESRKRKLSTGSNMEAESSEPHPKRHKHGKHQHHKHKCKGDVSETKLPATITSPKPENSVEKVVPFCSTPVSSGAKSAKRTILEEAPVSAAAASSRSSESDQFSLVKMSPLNNSKYLKKHKQDPESEELQITSKKPPKKKHKTKDYNEQTTQPHSKPASKEKVAQKNVLQSSLGGDWTRQEIASGDAKKLALLEKYFSGEKGAKKQEMKKKKDENKSAGKPSPSNKQNVIGKSNQLGGNTSENHMGKDIIKASTSEQVVKHLMKSMGSDNNSGEAHSTSNHKSPAKKLKMNKTSVLIATETQKLKNTKFPPDGKTVKEHSPLDSQQVHSAQETAIDQRKKAKKQKNEGITPAFVGNNKGLDISKDKETCNDSQFSSSTNNSEYSEISSKKKKKKKHAKKSKNLEKKKNRKETSKSMKIKSSESEIVNTQPIALPSKSSILLSESPSKKTKKPNDKVKLVDSSTYGSPQKKSLPSITPEISKVEKVREDEIHKIKSKNENSSKAGKMSLSSQNISLMTNQIESKPSEKNNKKKLKEVENTKTNNNQVSIDDLKQTPTEKLDNRSVNNLLSGNLTSPKIQKSKASQQNTLSKDSKTAKETLTNPLKKTQKSLDVKGNTKSKQSVGDDELFSKSFDFDAWEEKMKMIELLKSGGKLRGNESEEKVPTPTSASKSKGRKKKKQKKEKH